ncbi:MAG: HD-GYP domain-containing protein [Planctomycetota bacterium]|jgi:putative nucleotidyltransferase with HDIG domain
MARATANFDRVEHLLQGLSIAFYNRHLYGADHARAGASLRQFVGAIRTHIGERSDDQFRIAVRRGRFVHEGVPLQGGSNMFQLAARFEARGAGGVGFASSLTESSLVEFLDWLRAEGSGGSVSFAGIELLDAVDDDAVDDDPDRDFEPVEWTEFRTPVRVYECMADVLDTAHASVRDGGELDLHEINEIAHWTAEEIGRHGSRMLSPLQLLQKDSYTWQHSVNVAMIASTLLRPLASDQAELARFARAALLHDIGKSLIPEEILHKKGRLTDEEFDVMRRHAELGAQLLAGYPDLDAVDVEVAYCHHMRDDGLGYPVPQLPVKPGPVTAVVQVADMFEALTAHRPYKRSLSVEEAVDVIQRTPGMESKQAAVWMLMSHLTMSPPGSEVILASGERGVVITSRAEDPTRPLVMLMSDTEGEPLPEPRAVDLHEEKSGPDSEDRYVHKVILRFGGQIPTAIG